MKVCFETFGCRLNKAEALQMEADYLAKGWERTESHSDADLFVVRGCSVTARAQADCERLIAHLRKKYPTKPLQVCGCIKDTRATPNTSHKTHTLFSRPSRFSKPPQPSQPSQPSQPLPTRTARAYLKVQDGCSGQCAFCIVPTFRGKSASFDFTRALDRARRFIDAGYHEIVVTGCNLSLYASQGKRLPDLLDALADLDSGCRIRLGSLEPGACALETIHVIAAHDNICRFLHLPVQSGSNKILKSMCRPYAVKDVDTAVSTARQLMPNIGLGCDLMTGFPDESDLDFISTQGLVQRHRFSNVHVFPYSGRPGTRAVTYLNQIPSDIRSARAHELSKTAEGYRKSFARTFIGKTVQVVIEHERRLIGWTGEYLRCELPFGSVPRKSLVDVTVTKVTDDTLVGSVKK